MSPYFPGRPDTAAELQFTTPVSNEISEIVHSHLSHDVVNVGVGEYFSLNDRFEHYDTTTIAFCSHLKEFIGICAGRFYQEPHLSFHYWETLLVRDTYQGHMTLLPLMIESFLTKLISNRGFPRIITAKTSHPVIYKALKLMSVVNKRSFFPNFKLEIQDKKLWQTARQCCNIMFPDLFLCEKTGIIRMGMSTIGKSVYKKPPLSSTETLNTYFTSNLRKCDNFFIMSAWHADQLPADFNLYRKKIKLPRENPLSV